MIKVEVTRYFVGRDGHEAAISRAYTGTEEQGFTMVKLGIEECHKQALTLPFADLREMTEEEVAEYQDLEACVEAEKRQRIAASEAYFRDPNRGYAYDPNGIKDGDSAARATDSSPQEVAKMDQAKFDALPDLGTPLTEAELVKALQDDLTSDGDDHYFPLDQDPLGR